MKATDIALASIIISALAHAMQKKEFKPRHIIGSLGYLGIIAFIASEAGDITTKFAWLVLVGVILTHGVTVAKTMG